jgi:hypothetical protein
MKPMFTLNGIVLHVFETPKGVNKKTGEEYESQDKVQILGDVPLLNGQTRKDMITITTHDIHNLKTMLGRAVMLPVGMFAQGKGLITYFMPKGSKAVLDGLQQTPKTAS